MANPQKRKRKRKRGGFAVSFYGLIAESHKRIRKVKGYTKKDGTKVKWYYRRSHVKRKKYRRAEIQFTKTEIRRSKKIRVPVKSYWQVRNGKRTRVKAHYKRVPSVLYHLEEQLEKKIPPKDNWKGTLKRALVEWREGTVIDYEKKKFGTE